MNQDKFSGDLYEVNRRNLLSIVNKYVELKSRFADGKYSDFAFSETMEDLLDLLDLDPSILIKLTDAPSIVYEIRNISGYNKVRYEVFTEDRDLYVAYSVYKKGTLAYRNAGSHIEKIKELRNLLNRSKTTEGYADLRYGGGFSTSIRYTSMNKEEVIGTTANYFQIGSTKHHLTDLTDKEEAYTF